MGKKSYPQELIEEIEVLNENIIKLESELEAVKEENKELKIEDEIYNKTIEIKMKREKPFVEEWQKETGRTNTYPDYIGLIEHYRDGRNDKQKQFDEIKRIHANEILENDMANYKQLETTRKQFIVAMQLLGQVDNEYPMSANLKDEDYIKYEDLVATVTKNVIASDDNYVEPDMSDFDFNDIPDSIVECKNPACGTLVDKSKNDGYEYCNVLCEEAEKGGG